jgi:peptidoglycan-N-acetylglucosamine deacetylase
MKRNFTCTAILLLSLTVVVSGCGLLPVKLSLKRNTASAMGETKPDSATAAPNAVPVSPQPGATIQPSNSSQPASRSPSAAALASAEAAADLAGQTAANQAIVKAAVTYQVAGVGKKVALTFDDGPDNKFTPRILDVLKKHQIHATFFVVGEHAKQYPAVMKRIAEEGHIIGNHSWGHLNLTELTEDKIRSEIVNTDDTIATLTNQTPILLRAPYGAVNVNVVKQAESSNLKIIGWSVDTLDWDGKSVAQILENVRKEVRPGAIILQHSAGGKKGDLSNTVAALPEIISYLEQKGYTFCTVPELLASKTK